MRWSCAVAAVCPIAMGAASAGDSLPYDLSQVRGIDAFPDDPALRDLLARNGFVVVPRVHKQLFSPYLDRAGSRALGARIPPFVTVESAVRTYGVRPGDDEEALGRVRQTVRSHDGDGRNRAKDLSHGQPPMTVLPRFHLGPRIRT
jgi:hypothetical protein